MKILWIGHIDPGGISAMYANAINKYTTHECRVITFAETRNFDSDIVLQRSMWGGFNTKPPEFWSNEFMRLFDACDCIVFNMAVAIGASNPDFKNDDSSFRVNDEEFFKLVKRKNKPVYAFFFGSNSLRANYKYYTGICKERQWPVITCQPDIHYEVTALKHPCTYVPILVTSDHNRYRNSFFDFFTKDNFLISNVGICHSPTDKRIKNTDEFISVIQELNSSSNTHIQPFIIENAGFYDSLFIKKMCHIAFDQMQTQHGYYCLSSVENSTLGLVNHVFLNTYGIDLIGNDMGLFPPWKIVSNRDELKKSFNELILDNGLLYDQMLESYTYFRNTWTDKNHIHKLIGAL